MLIKNATLHLQLPSILPTAFCLLGQDSFQIEHFSTIIQRHWKQLHPHSDKLGFDIDAKSGWDALKHETAHYPLFNEHRLFSVNFPKKSLDKEDKNTLSDYLQQPPKDSLLIITAPQLTMKAVEAFWSVKNIQIIAAIEPAPVTVQKWIIDQLARKDITIAPKEATLLFQFSEGNLRAIAQYLEKITLIQDKNSVVKAEELIALLHDQSHFSLFHLPQFCFENVPLKAIKLLRQAEHQKQDPTLVLWVLTQAIRQVYKLQVLMKDNTSFTQAASQLKIWSNQFPIYQLALKKFDANFLQQNIQFCALLDKQLKMGNPDIYQKLETVALNLCKGA